MTSAAAGSDATLLSPITVPPWSRHPSLSSPSFSSFFFRSLSQAMIPNEIYAKIMPIKQRGPTKASWNPAMNLLEGRHFRCQSLWHGVQQKQSTLQAAAHALGCWLQTCRGNDDQEIRSCGASIPC
jgi:hypothetical protein